MILSPKDQKTFKCKKVWFCLNKTWKASFKMEKVQSNCVSLLFINSVPFWVAAYSVTRTLQSQGGLPSHLVPLRAVLQSLCRRYRLLAYWYNSLAKPCCSTSLFPNHAQWFSTISLSPLPQWVPPHPIFLEEHSTPCEEEYTCKASMISQIC